MGGKPPRRWNPFKTRFPPLSLYYKEQSTANSNSFKIAQKTAFEAKGRLYTTGEVIAFSRHERTHPNFVSQARETEIFGLQFGRPSKFLQGLRASFLCPLGTKRGQVIFPLCFGVFRSVRRSEVFLELVFTPIAFDKKKCRLSAD